MQKDSSKEADAVSTKSQTCRHGWRVNSEVKFIGLDMVQKQIYPDQNQLEPYIAQLKPRRKNRSE
jgi:hypothetical protein